MQPYVIGIDIGTGSTKAVAVDDTGKIIGSYQRHYGVKNPQPGYYEQDPELIWEAFIKCVANIVASVPHEPAAISLSSAMHSLIPVDHNGIGLAPMMTWADSRSESIAQRIIQSVDGQEIYTSTGTPVHAMSPLCKIIWIRENNYPLFLRTHKFISIKEYIWYKLFNVFEVDYSVASATGLFDILKLCWNDKACSLAGISRQMLSSPVNTGYSRYDLSLSLSKRLGLSASVPFVIGGSDGCCANLGSGVNKRGLAALTIGTSGAVRITSSVPVYNYAAMTFNYLLDDKMFICGGPVNNGGNVLDWLIKTFFNKTELTNADYDEAFAEIDAIKPGSDGLIFLPYLYGERAPIWDSRASGSYINIGPHHTRSHFLRAGLEGVCFGLNDVLQEVESPERPIHELIVSGGFVSSRVWTQMLADVTGKKITISNLDDASAIGAAYLGFASLFADWNINAIQNSQLPVHTLRPHNSNYETYCKTFTFFKKLYKSLKANMHELYDDN